jgi:hypothetical protein
VRNRDHAELERTDDELRQRIASDAYVGTASGIELPWSNEEAEL